VFVQWPGTVSEAGSADEKLKAVLRAIVCVCNGCQRGVTAADKIPNWNYHRECKRAYDALVRLSKKQNESEWWEETKGNPKKLKAAIKDYITNVGTGMGRGKNRNQSVWKIAHYKGRIKTRTEVENRSRGQMMWKEQYIRWAESVDGGFLSRSDAEQN